ncbi:unnamed protein product, partial [Symbiodinium sp. KB8]
RCLLPQLRPPNMVGTGSPSGKEMFAWTLPAVAAATASQEQVTGQGATSTQAVNAPAPAFPPGCQVTVLDEIVVRAKESLDSEVITVLREGTLLDVLRRGLEPETRRLYVRHDQSECFGWISCVARSGHPWVSLVVSQGTTTLPGRPEPQFPQDPQELAAEPAPSRAEEATTTRPSMQDPSAPEDTLDPELNRAERYSDQEVLRALQISAGDSRRAWKEMDRIAGAWLASVPQEAWASAAIMS